MPAELDLHDQLRSYGEWLADRPGVDLARGAPPEIDLDLDADVVALAPRRASRSQRTWWLAAAASAIAIVGVAGIALTASEDAPAPAQSPADPDDYLYVLPRGDTGVQLTNGSFSSSYFESADGIVVATPAQRGYTTPMRVAISATRRTPFSEWTVVSANGRTAYVDRAGGVTVVTQRRDAVWLSIAGGPDREPEIIERLAHVEVDDRGSLMLAAGSSLAIVGRTDADESGTIHSTYVEAGDGVVIETTTAADPLFGLLDADTIERYRIHGTDGWLVSRVDPDATWHGIVWMGTPNRAVAVSGTAPFDEVRSIAESLVLVDEATWVAATDAVED